MDLELVKINRQILADGYTVTLGGTFPKMPGEIEPASATYTVEMERDRILVMTLAEIEAAAIASVKHSLS